MVAALARVLVAAFALLGATVATALGAGPAFTEVPSDYSGDSFGFAKRAVAAGDVTGDGAPEIVMAGEGIGALQLTADPAAPVRIPFDIPDNDPDPDFAYDDVAIASLSNDGLPDIVAAGPEGARRFVQTIVGGERRFAQDGGRLVAGPLDAVATGLLDADALPDLVVVGPQGGFVLRRQAPGQFAAAIPFLTGEDLADVVVGDVTGDGRADIVAVGTGGARLLVQDDQSFAFDARPQPFAPGALTSVVAGRFDANGTLDVAASRPGTDEVLIRLGRGDGTFDAGARLDVIDNPGALAVGDLDLDGTADLVVARRASADADEIRDRASVLRGSGAGTFSAGATIRVSDLPGQDQSNNDVRSIAVADIDRDARPDLLFADAGLSAAIVARNTTTLVTDPGTGSGGTSTGGGSTPTGPGLTVVPARRQILSLRQGILVRAACASACTIRASGRISVGVRRGRPRVVRLGGFTRALVAGQGLRFALAIPSRRWPVIRHGLARRSRITATVLVTARDAAGTTTTYRLVLRLVPRRAVRV